MKVECYFCGVVIEKYNDRVFLIPHFNINFEFKIRCSFTMNKNEFLKFLKYFSNSLFNRQYSLEFQILGL